MKIDKNKRMILAFVVVFILALFPLKNFLNGYLSESASPEDTNVYLNEEVCYAKDIYIKVIGINVIQNVDENSDIKYYLNLTLSIEQKAEKKPKGTKISPQNFQLRAINQEAKGRMGVFFEALAKTTIETAIELAVEGEVNIIEKTIDFADEYSSARLDDIQTNKKLKAIKLEKSSFAPFRPKDESVGKQLEITFPLTEEYLETDQILTLSIDSKCHFERRIFLTVRPQIATDEE